MQEPRSRFPLDPHESALLALGALVSAWTVERRAFSLFAECAFATTLLASAIAYCARREATCAASAFDRWSRLRIFASFPFMLWFYCVAVGRLVPALGEPLRDATLLSIDRAIFGETPSVAATRLALPLAVEVLSLCYVSLHIMMFTLLIWAFSADAARARRICQPVFLAFAIGFLGYITVPAIGPERAFPALFATPLPVGPLSALNTRIIDSGTALYDVFPSLHTGIALCILIHDARANRRRFYWLLLPCIGIIVSTIVLRYHYAIDLAAGALLAVAVNALPAESRRRSTEQESFGSAGGLSASRVRV